MHLALIAILLFFFFPSEAKTSKQGSPPAAAPAKHYYFEVPPGEEKKITIQAIKCDPQRNELQVKEFRSTQPVTNGKVLAVNIYARAGTCKESALSSVWSQEIFLPVREHWAHVYITVLSENIMVL